MAVDINFASGWDGHTLNDQDPDFWPLIEPGSFSLISAKIEVFSIDRLLRAITGAGLPRIRGLFNPDQLGLTLVGSMDSDYNLLDAGTIINTGLQFLPLVGLRRSVFLDEVFLRIMAEAPSSLGWYVRPIIETEITLLNPALSKAKMLIDLFPGFLYLISQGRTTLKGTDTYTLRTDLSPGESSYSVYYGPSITWHGMGTGSYSKLFPVDSRDFFRAFGLNPGFEVALATFANNNGRTWGVGFGMGMNFGDLGVIGTYSINYFLALR